MGRAGQERAAGHAAGMVAEHAPAREGVDATFRWCTRCLDGGAGMIGAVDEHGDPPSAARKIRYVLADDDFLVRTGTETILALDDRLELVGSCGDSGRLRRLVEEKRPDVVVTDIRMPPESDAGMAFARELRERAPEVGVVVLSQYLHPAYALALFEHGTERRAYLLKERVADRGRLAEAICDVAAGGSVVDPKVVEALVAARRSTASSPLDELTAREHEVLKLVAQGKSNGAIAADLFLTKRAVEKHINSIFAKLSLRDEALVSRRVTAALLYLSAGDRP